MIFSSSVKLSALDSVNRARSGGMHGSNNHRDDIHDAFKYSHDACTLSFKKRL